MNNILLVTAAASVLLGTLYPLFLDALDLGKISVGAPYFAAVFVPLMLPLVFLIGVGPLARWKQSRIGELIYRLRFVFVAALVVGVLLPLVVGGTNRVLIAAGITLGTWTAISAVMNLGAYIRRQAAHQSTGRALANIPRAVYGMTLAHLGIAVFIVGVTFTSAFEVERELRMDPGASAQLGGYQFQFLGAGQVEGPNYIAQQGRILVTRDGQRVTILHPQKRIYRVQTNPMTEAGIDSTMFRDLYVALGEPLSGGAWGVRLYYKPFVFWLWLGPVLMALGGVLAASDRRYRAAVRREAAVSAGNLTPAPLAS